MFSVLDEFEVQLLWFSTLPESVNSSHHDKHRMDPSKVILYSDDYQLTKIQKENIKFSGT
jgi:hypothetical protein